MSRPQAQTTAAIESHVAGDKPLLAGLRANIAAAFQGKEDVVDLTLTALLAHGHVLLEDVPGTGKTTLARSVASSLDCQFRRVQFTSDLLPSDVLGVSVFRDETGVFEFRKGPIFANIVLADEINRTTPRTQSALLEAMSEGRVTIDNTTHPLPDPFMVIATQNPKEFYGTYPLPESQLDRFMLRLSIGYPERDVERDIIRQFGWGDAADTLKTVAHIDDLKRWQSRVEGVVVDPSVLDYLMSLVTSTRESRHLDVGVSTRGAIALFRACQARAYLLGRHYVTPDDVQVLTLPVFCHRIWVQNSRQSGAAQRDEASAILNELLEGVPVPR
jgi:MoxR-like ATPase